MPEADTIHHDALPLTVGSLREQFVACGLAAGQTVLVHSAMSKMGWIAGGQVAVIQALLQVLGDTGTLMMPAHSAANTNPANWQRPPVPEHWWQIIRDQTPPFDPRTTPTRGMGAVAELFRTWPGVIRSAHPVGSFAAIGPNAAYLLGNHDATDDMLGESSPVGRLYALDGYLMLLGVGHSNNTSLHLAEHRADFPGKQIINEGSAIIKDGQRRWVEYEMLDYEMDDFEAIGAAYEARYDIPIHSVGRARVRLLRQRPIVDFAVSWMEENRDSTRTEE